MFDTNLWLLKVMYELTVEVQFIWPMAVRNCSHIKVVLLIDEGMYDGTRQNS